MCEEKSGSPFNLKYASSASSMPLRDRREKDREHNGECVCDARQRFGTATRDSLEPRQQLLRAVVRVDDDWDVVQRCDGTHMVRQGHGACDGRLVSRVLDAFAAVERAATLAHLNDDRALGLRGSLKACVDARRRNAVDCRDGKARGLGPLEEFQDLIANEDSGLDRAASTD